MSHFPLICTDSRFALAHDLAIALISIEDSLLDDTNKTSKWIIVFKRIPVAMIWVVVSIGSLISDVWGGSWRTPMLTKSPRRDTEKATLQRKQCHSSPPEWPSDEGFAHGMLLCGNCCRPGSRQIVVNNNQSACYIPPPPPSTSSASVPQWRGVIFIVS